MAESMREDEDVTGPRLRAISSNDQRQSGSNRPSIADGHLTARQQKFADKLLGVGAVRFGSFRLKLHETQPDAPLSPIYIDLRVLRSYPKAFKAAVDVLKEMVRGLECDHVADVPMAATPLVAVLAYETERSMITPRPPKSYGLQSSIDGAYFQGETILVIDDVVTHADSKLEAIRVLEAEELVVRDVVVLVDREQGGAQQLADAGYRLHAAVTLTQLLDYWRASGSIDEATYQRVQDYLSQAQG